MTNIDALPRRRVIAALAGSARPMTGRQVATSALVSPTTAMKILQQLKEEGLVASTPDGRSTRWRTTPAAMDTASGTTTALPSRRALLVTALPLETAALRRLLPEGRTIREASGTRSFETSLTGSHVAWQVRVLQGGVGNVSAASAVAQRLDDFLPDLLIFVGIAGGLKPDDAQHGDVVIVTRAYNASAGKEVEEGDLAGSFLSRPISIPVTHMLEELARTVVETTKLRSAKISLGAVASTEAVLGDARGEIYRRIRSHINDCSIVDMESFGVLSSARRIGVAAISVRGISDFVADKTSDADERRQPEAASNAAKVALRFLRDAEPADVGHANDRKPEQQITTADGHVSTTPLEHEALSTNAEPWYQLLKDEDPDRADEARLALLRWRPSAIATHASRTIDRPPDWLKSDLSGHAWAMVASVAGAAGAGVAGRAYREAARRARAAGAAEIAGLHEVSGILADHGRKTLARNSDAERNFLNALTELDLSSSPVAERHRAIILSQADRIAQDWGPALAAAKSALAAVEMGTVEVLGTEGMVGDGELLTTTLPDPIRRSFGSGVAMAIATFQVLREDGVAALQAADLALALTPRSGTARLRRAQSLLALLIQGVTDSGAGPREHDTLKEIERLALEAHSILTEWDNDGAEALALAGRARVQVGDAQGALRLLLPQPDGGANPSEATHGEVLRIVAVAAAMIGNHDLALRSSESLAEDGEALVLRARALEQMPGMAREARATYGRALAMRGTDHTVLERSLIGLARTGAPLHEIHREASDEGEPASRENGANWAEMHTALKELRRLKPRAADIVVGQAALSNNDARRALRLGLAHRDHVQGIELVADAYEAIGAPDKALECLWEFGKEKGDIALMLDALSRAVRHGDFDRVRDYSDSIIRDHGGEARRMARRARLGAAGLANDWATVDFQAQKLLDEQGEPGGEQLSPNEVLHCRWTRVEALMMMHQPRSAFSVLKNPHALGVRRREEAQLALAVIHRLADEGSAPDGETIDWVLELASAWLDDEEVCRQAIAILLTGGGEVDLARVARARSVTERYFDRHKDAAQIKQILLNGELDDDTAEAPEGYFDPLFEELRRQAAGQEQINAKIHSEVTRGRLPVAMVSALLEESYAKLLITYAFGVQVVSAAHSPAPSRNGIATAREALAAGSVSVDTSALVVGCKLGVERRDLLGMFSDTYLADALRTDMLHARAKLGRRSDTTLGWDSRRDQPRVAVTDAATVDGWAAEASDLCGCLAMMKIRRVGTDINQTYGLHALEIAAQLGVALWADDAAMRALATERGVSSFTTLDLIEVLREGQPTPDFPSPEDVVVAARDARIVDLPMPTSWWSSAQADAWNPNEGTATAIARAAAWRDPGAAFTQFRGLVERLIADLPDAPTSGVLAGWTLAGAHGLATAVEDPATRAPMTANLLTWVILRYEAALDPTRISTELAGTSTPEPDRAELLDSAYAIMRDVGEVDFPNADAIRHLTTTLAESVRSVVDAPTTMRVVLGALGLLTDELTREAAIKSLLSFPPVPEERA